MYLYLHVLTPNHATPLVTPCFSLHYNSSHCGNSDHCHIAVMDNSVELKFLYHENSSIHFPGAKHSPRASNLVCFEGGRLPSLLQVMMIMAATILRGRPCLRTAQVLWPLHTFHDGEESDCQLPFLDILLNREEDGSNSTSVHRKATHTDQHLCFHSHQPSAHKRAVVRTLICITEALSSSGVSRVQEEKLVSQALQGNGYPKGFIHKHTCPLPDC